jgi:hypothetical protein
MSVFVPSSGTAIGPLFPTRLSADGLEADGGAGLLGDFLFLAVVEVVQKSHGRSPAEKFTRPVAADKAW